jgi:hypothetical protein
MLMPFVLLVHWECHCPKSVHRLTKRMSFSYTGLRIRIHRIRMFLGLLDLDRDPLVRGSDPDLDPFIIKKNSMKKLDSCCFVTSF